MQHCIFDAHLFQSNKKAACKSEYPSKQTAKLLQSKRVQFTGRNEAVFATSFQPYLAKYLSEILSYSPLAWIFFKPELILSIKALSS